MDCISVFLFIACVLSFFFQQLTHVISLFNSCSFLWRNEGWKRSTALWKSKMCFQLGTFDCCVSYFLRISHRIPHVRKDLGRSPKENPCSKKVSRLDSDQVAQGLTQVGLKPSKDGNCTASLGVAWLFSQRKFSLHIKSDQPLSQFVNAMLCSPAMGFNTKQVPSQWPLVGIEGTAVRSPFSLFSSLWTRPYPQPPLIGQVLQPCGLALNLP